MKNISILGSTGSIGTQTLEIIRNNKEINVSALAAGSNIVLLEEQIREFKPKLAVVWDEVKARELKIALGDMDIRIAAGMDGLIEAAVIEDADIVVTAIVGMIGIRPTLAAIETGKDIALANKETLVTAGHIIMPLAEKKKIRILPVDSEHSAIFQCLNGENPKEISKIILTASGGPFRDKSLEELRQVTLAQALNHPNWTMGKKITIDSATMVNKGLEVIEAKWLFDVEINQVEVVVQPQSLIHSMIEFADGAIIAQLGTPDMLLPIQYALFYPERRISGADKVDFRKLSEITFEQPDMVKFRGLALAYKAGRIGGSMPTVLNAANELAVAQFLNKKIGFLQIADIIEYCMDQHKIISDPTVEQILETEQETYDIITRNGYFNL